MTVLMNIEHPTTSLTTFDREWYDKLHERRSCKRFNKQTFEVLFKPFNVINTIQKYCALNKFSHEDCILMLSLLKGKRYGVLYLFRENRVLFNELLKHTDFNTYQRLCKTLFQTKHSDYAFSYVSFLRTLYDRKIVTNDDLHHIVNATSWTYFKLIALLKNKWLLSKCLRDFLIEKSSLDAVEQELSKFDEYKNDSLFSMLKYSYNDEIFRAYYTITEEEAKEFIQQSECYQTVCEFPYSVKDLKELYELSLKNNSVFDLLQQFVNSNLQDAYSYSQLVKLVSRSSLEKKHKLNF